MPKEDELDARPKKRGVFCVAYYTAHRIPHRFLGGIIQNKFSQKNELDILKLQVISFPKSPRSKKSNERPPRNRSLKIASYVCSEGSEKSDFFGKMPKTAI